MTEQEREVLESINRFVENQYPRNARLSTKELGDGFCKWCLQEIFELAEDQAEEAMAVGGSGDNGMDAIFEQEDQLFVVQTKYGRSHSFESVAGFVSRMKQVQRGQVSGNRPEVLHAAAALQDQASAGGQIFFYYITNSFFSPGDESRIKNMFRSAGNQQFKAMDMRRIVAKLQERSVDVPDSFKRRRFRLAAEIPPLEINDSLVMPIRLSDLARFVTDAGDYLYHSNIRNYLRRTTINRGIETTLSEHPDRFWMYNNGITIVCDDYEVEGSMIVLKTPQVVNGCQTASTVTSFLKGKSQIERESFPGRVLVRVIRDSSPQERAEVTRWTNSQNAVKGKDFLSLDRFQKQMQRSMKEHGYFYEIQRGSFAIMGRADKLQYRGSELYDHLASEKPVVCVPAPEAVQGFVAAFLQQPHIAYGRPSELMPHGNEYKRVFNDDTPSTPEHFLIPFLVAQSCSQRFKYGHGGEHYRRYGRWFFVTTTFAALTKMLQLMTQLHEQATVQSVTADQLRKVFSHKDISDRLLLLAEEVILDRYFDDHTIRRQVRDDYWNYFKAGCSSSQAQEILREKINDAFRKREGQQLLDLATRAFGS